MKPALITGAVILAFLCVGLLFRFGTITPCGMLKQELKSEYARSMIEKRTGDTWEQASLGLSLALAGPLIDNIIDTLTPIQCMRGLYQLATGENPFAEHIGFPSDAFPTGRSTAGTSHWEHSAKIRAARLQIEMLGTALDTFRLDVGRYPTTQEGLRALLTRPPDLTKWDGPYFRRKEIPYDPWGYAYVYISNDPQSYELLSYGADGLPDSEGVNADITSW